MKDITYTIQFFSFWHCGSGLAAGADVDALVVKDENGLPFVPGKTIKGLVRESIELICQLYPEKVNEDLIQKAFGFFDNKDKKINGSLFFTNAELPEAEKVSIIKNDMAEFLYDSISSTAIDDKGIAKDHSLRRQEVVVPCTLTGKILHVDEDLEGALVESMDMIKHLGVNRNRGLGRCKITLVKEEKGGNS